MEADTATYKLNEPRIVEAVGQAAGIGTAVGQATFTIHAPLPPRHAVYGAIGRIVAEGARLEHILDLIIWDLSGVQQILGACITSQMMGPSPRYKVIESLAKAKGLDKKIIEKTRRLTKRTFDNAEYRNRLVHDPWYMEKKTRKPGQFRKMPYKGQQFGIEDIDTTETSTKLKELRDLSDSAENLRNTILAALET